MRQIQLFMKFEDMAEAVKCQAKTKHAENIENNLNIAGNFLP
jgi:hypothetical protein